MRPCSLVADLYEAAVARGDFAGLRGAPVVNVADAVDAADSAVGRAGLCRQKLALDVCGGVVGQWHAGVAALLAAIVHQAVFADVEVARAGAAAPVIGQAFDDGFLEVIELRVVGLFAVLHGEIDLRVGFSKGLELAVAVMDDADGGFEAELQGALADDEGVVGVLEAAADDGVDVDVELGVLCEHLEFLVEDLEGLFRHFIGVDVVDGDLHVVEAGAVEALNALGVEQIAIGDHAGDGAGFAHALDDEVEIGMREGLAAGDADHGGAEAAEMVDAAEHLVCGHGRGDFVELVAVGAGEIAETRGDDLDEDRVRGRGEGTRDHRVLAGFARRADGAATDRVSAEFGHLYY